MPWAVLLAFSVSIELVSSSARVTSVKFQQGLSVSDRDRERLATLKIQNGDSHLSHLKAHNGENSHQLHWKCTVKKKIATGETSAAITSFLRHTSF